MIFWLAVALLTAGALMALLWPLLAGAGGGGDADETNADHDLRVYRSQLAEVERDAARGQLAPADAEAARAEIGRRLLSADRARTSADRARPADRRLRAVAPYALAFGVPAATFGLYLALGQPGAPDQPLAARDLPAGAGATAERAAGDRSGRGAGEADGARFAAAVERLRERLAKSPDDLRGWRLLARTQAMRGDYAAAVEAYETARDLAPDDPALKADLAETLVLAAGGTVTPRAAELFRAVAGTEAAGPRTRHYLALADFQAGDHRAALNAWLALANEAPADAAYLPLVRRRAMAAADALGVDVADRLPPAPADGAPAQAPATSSGEPPAMDGPTAEDMAAARKMSPEARREMIAGMVDRLARRLEDNPDDLAGWRRLARSYRVLDRPEDALEALERASELAPGDVGLLTARARVMRELAGDAPTPETVDLMREVAEIAPDNVEANWFLGLAALRGGERETARSRFDRALAGLPADSTAREELARQAERLLGSSGE